MDFDKIWNMNITSLQEYATDTWSVNKTMLLTWGICIVLLHKDAQAEENNEGESCSYTHIPYKSNNNYNAYLLIQAGKSSIYKNWLVIVRAYTGRRQGVYRAYTGCIQGVYRA